jgi:hypothetical protein
LAVKLVVALAGAVLLAGCGSTRTVVRTVTAPAQGVTYVGHIASMSAAGDGYLVQFDPQFDFTGVTANVAAARDQHVRCAPRSCASVPNDVYSVDETHRAYTFLMRTSTSGTVLTDGSNLNGTRISAVQLAAIVAGGGMKLYEPLESGVKITVRNDTITTFAQQFRP